MISSIHFPDKTYENLTDLIGHEKEKTGNKKMSASRMVSQLIDKEHAIVKPKRYEKGKEAGSDNGVQEQSGGEQNDTAGSQEE